MKHPHARRSTRAKGKPAGNREICVPVPSKILARPTVQQQEKINQAAGYLNVYKELVHHYSLTQTRELYIMRIASDVKIPLQFQSLPLLKLIKQTISEMMMNDIEIVMWAIYLDRFAWKEFSLCLKILMYITAFAVKSYLGSSIEHFQAYLSFKFTNFSLYFNKWLEKSKHRLSTSAKELNKKFIYLSHRISLNELSLINYNYTVDTILDMAPPYHHEGFPQADSQPSSLHSSYFEPASPCLPQDIEAQEVQSDEDSNFPLLARLDSVFANSKPEIDKACDLGSTLSMGINNSWMLDNLDALKPNPCEEDPIPQLSEHQSLFTFYLSQSLN